MARTNTTSESKMLTHPSIGDEVMYKDVAWYVQWTDGNVAYLVPVNPNPSEGLLDSDGLAAPIADLEVA